MHKAAPLEFVLRGSKDSPLINPAILIKNWKSDRAEILVNGKKSRKSKWGINHKLDGDRLIVFLPLHEEEPVTITIDP